MAVRRTSEGAPEEFLAAIQAVRDVRLRTEVSLDEVPAPQRIAPHAMALSADVVVDDEELGNGRFVLLYDPDGQDAWEGRFRCVTFVRAALEPELGSDPMIGDVGWTWLQECLANANAESCAAGGTVTRVVSESFGALSERAPTVEIEVRASWTPMGDIGAHFTAWGALLCTVAGLPPLPAGVAALTRRR